MDQSQSSSSHRSAPFFPYSKMCRPSLMNINHHDALLSCAQDHHDRSTSVIGCVLCGARAALYCHADSAFLCRACDKSVHAANILALRHVRCVLCKTCQRFTRRYVVGASTEVTPLGMVSVVRRWTARSGRERRRLGHEGNHELSLGTMNKSPISSCSSS